MNEPKEAEPAALTCREAAGGYAVRPYKRFFAVIDGQGDLVVVAVYKKGAAEVVRRLSAVGCSTCRCESGGRPCASR